MQRGRISFLFAIVAALALTLVSVAFACTVSISGQTIVTDPADVDNQPDPVGAANPELNDVPGTLAVSMGETTFKAKATGVSGGTWKLYVRQHVAPVPDSVPPMDPTTTHWACMGLAALPAVGDDAVSDSVTASGGEIPETVGTLPATDGGSFNNSYDNTYDSATKHRGLIAVCFLSQPNLMDGTEHDILSVI